MPYKWATNKIKLSREHDKRVKITEEKKNEIKTLYKIGTSQRGISLLLGVSRRMIAFILFPEREARAKALFKERRKDGRYYNREKATKQTREHRRRKQEILKAM